MYDPMLDTALAAAAAAAEVIRAAYRQGVDVRYKGDDSPVTEVDEAAEQVIRDTVLGRYPDHGFYGEELGRDGLDAEFLWLSIRSTAPRASCVGTRSSPPRSP